MPGFENLIRQLFEAIELEVNVTQSSRDEGIDAVAYIKTDIVHPRRDPDPGQALQQMRPRQRRPRPGRIRRGSTPHIRNPRHHRMGRPRKQGLRRPQQQTPVIEGGELKHLLDEYLHLDVRVDLARRPQRPG